MFVGNNFKEDPSSEINPIEAFGTDELEDVWNGFTDSIDSALIRDFELTIWYKASGKIHGSSFTYKVDEVHKAYEKLRNVCRGGLVKVIKIELTPRIKNVFIDINVKEC